MNNPRAESDGAKPTRRSAAGDRLKSQCPTPSGGFAPHPSVHENSPHLHAKMGAFV